MTTAVYDAAREGFAKAELDWELATYVAYMLKDTYVYDSSHVIVDIPGSAIIATSAPFTPLEPLTGYLKSQNVTFLATPSLVPRPVCAGFAVGETVSGLLVYYTNEAIGMPLTILGGDYRFFVDATTGAFARI